MAKLLDRLYQKYNRLYFAGQLPYVPVKWSEQIQPSARERSRQAYGWFVPSEDADTVGVILLAAETKPYPERYRLTLLHECCHVKLRDHPDELKSTNDKHSKVWQKEMQRLAAAGAFSELW